MYIQNYIVPAYEHTQVRYNKSDMVTLKFNLGRLRNTEGGNFVIGNTRKKSLH